MTQSSHMRRMNPRDTKLEVFADVSIHRILRWSTSYGPMLSDGVLKDDGQDRGLDFIGISARAMDTIEFLQSEWMNKGDFFRQGNEKDPLMGII